MKLIVDGNLDQVVSFLKKPSFADRPLRGYGSTRAINGTGRVAKKNAFIREQADTLRAAFVLVRYDPDAKEMAGTLLAALVGRSERTQDILNKASAIILSRQPPQSS